MTTERTQRPPARRRGHAAAGARWLTAGMAAAGVVGISTYLALDDARTTPTVGEGAAAAGSVGGGSTPTQPTPTVPAFPGGAVVEPGGGWTAPGLPPAATPTTQPTTRQPSTRQPTVQPSTRQPSHATTRGSGG